MLKMKKLTLHLKSLSMMGLIEKPGTEWKQNFQVSNGDIWLKDESLCNVYCYSYSRY